MLLFMDGFDHYGSGGAIVNYGKWGTITGSQTLFSASNTVARTGTYSLALYYTGDEAMTKPYLTTGGFAVGMAIHLQAAATGGDIIRIREGTSIVHMAIAFNTSGQLQVKVGTNVVATGAVSLSLNSWHYVEFAGVIDSVNGMYELRIDGNQELRDPGPVNTRNGGTGRWDRMGILSGVAGWKYYVDDVYLCDLSGTVRNNFLGPVKIETLLPQIGNGHNIGLTPSAGTDHGTLVRETPPNTTDYNQGATVGLKDTYNLPTPTLTGVVLGVQVSLYVAKTDVGNRQVCAELHLGGSPDGGDFDGANQLPATTFFYLSDVWAQNPGTSVDWTIADLTNLEAGMKVTV